jgi:hypothetical protein
MSFVLSIFSFFFLQAQLTEFIIATKHTGLLKLTEIIIAAKYTGALRVC